MRVLLIDQSPMLRDGLRLVLEGLAPGVEIDEAATCRAVQMEALDRYELVLTECTLACQGRNCALEALDPDRTHSRLIVFSDDALDHTMRTVLDRGASGYISKLVDARRLCRGLARAIRGEAVVIPPPSFKRRAGNHESQPAARAETLCAQSAALPQPQRDMLRLVSQGRSNGYIARELGIARSDADSGLADTFRLLGVSSRADLLLAVAECATD